MKLRKILVLGVIFVLITGLAFAKGGAQSGAASSGKKQIVVGYAPPTMNNPFFAVLEDGLKSVLEPQGIKVVDFHADNDQSIQNNKVNDLLVQGIDALVLIPRDSIGVREALLACKAKGVPIVIADTPLVTDADKAMVVSTVASDNWNAGAVVAKDMMTRLPQGSPIVIMHSPAAGSCIPRYEGFLAAQKVNGQDYFNVLQVYDGEGAIDKTMPKAEDALTTYPQLKAIYCINDPSSGRLL